MNQQTEISTRSLQTDVAQIESIVMELEVTSQESFSEMESYIKGLKALDKQIAEFMDGDIKRAHDAHKGLTAKRKALTDPLKVVIKIGQAKLGAFVDRMRRAEAEERAAAESILRAEQAAGAAEIAEQIAETEGIEAGFAYLDAASKMSLPSVPAIKLAPVTVGGSTRTAWKFEVMDESLVPRGYLMVDENAIGAIVRARKGAVKIEGVRIYSETTHNV